MILHDQSPAPGRAFGAIQALDCRACGRVAPRHRSRPSPRLRLPSCGARRRRSRGACLTPPFRQGPRRRVHGRRPTYPAGAPIAASLHPGVDPDARQLSQVPKIAAGYPSSLGCSVGVANFVRPRSSPSLHAAFPPPLVIEAKPPILGGAPQICGGSSCPPQRANCRRVTCARPKPRASSASPAARWKSTGPTAPVPRYRKLGGRVVYALDDLKAWADRGAKTSTSDPGVGTVLPAKRHAAVRSLRRPDRAADRSGARHDATQRNRSRPNASSSICFARCPAISRRATRRTSWPIRSSRLAKSKRIDADRLPDAGKITIQCRSRAASTAWRPSGTPTC